MVPRRELPRLEITFPDDTGYGHALGQLRQTIQQHLQVEFISDLAVLLLSVLQKRSHR